ncbi:uncharacterized protein with HEPN domain [Methylorubrum rhodinum]|uniref:Uncharacterized protein with HEPN domain n=1 Tax=Methylorubrum rhodinum TaxID=29428 RepID=A0A840ZQU3_9HYPH|nr:HepT-like ribonuclease domain-containing protein [Methylorubrum rhodinum]MBB5759976.1 uncharacterized protein with HEPN domain [Methylorubrum rhodinum]
MTSAKRPEVRLRHILEQIDGIVTATRGRSFEEIQGNFLYERAVERAVQIVSEAAKELPADLRERHPDGHWQPIIRIGNLLRHEYYRIRSRDMWEIATVHLPVLRPVIVAMLTEFDS